MADGYDKIQNLTNSNQSKIFSLSNNNCMKHPVFQQKLLQYSYFFFLSAFIGFVWEVIFTLIRQGTLCNRGFFYGPWLPIYGIGGVLFYRLLHPIRKHYILCFFLSVLIGTSIELAIGLFVNRVYHLRYWNYSDEPYNYLGQICLYSSLGFGAAGLLWVCFISRYALYWWQKLPLKKQKALLFLLLLLFLADCILAVYSPNTGRGITY